MSQRRRKKKNNELMVARIVLGVSVVCLVVLLILVIKLTKAQKNPTNPVPLQTTEQESTQPFSSEGDSQQSVVVEPTSVGEPTQPVTDEQNPSNETNPTQTDDTNPTQSVTPTSSEPAQPTTWPDTKVDTSYKNPMSKHELHEGKWDLATLDNTGFSFGYSESNRADNMVPTDWAYYENKWGMYNVDWIQDINSNTIYLTMDVGFANDYTEGILDTLKDKNVKVVFFITKMFFDASPNTVQRMLDEGHIVGNHTCTHPNMPSKGIEGETAEIMDLWNAMHDKFGYEMKLFRFPEGRFSHQSLALVENLGMKTVFWSYAYNDYSSVQPEVQPSYERAVSYLHPGAIYLLHASSSTNAAFLGDFIDAARGAGYEFGVYPLSAN